MSTSSPEHVPHDPSTAAAGPAHEPLACVSCRSRKLKCDRQKPVCARCARAGGECLYPESRRKPAFKRRNVRELEERLAQVEGLLKTVGKQRVSQSAQSDGAFTEDSSPGTLGGEPSRAERPRGSPLEGAMPWTPLSSTESPSSGDNAPKGELLGFGQFESLPPFEMIEDLHGIFFGSQQHFLPIIHPTNYLRSFHAPPHMRPPLGLQYAIWTVAANMHPKYGCYHDALYRRARQYLESDELKGHGEHFITIGHAQAWTLLATDEARRLLFTRASMSSARSVRLAGMMGLHRLDSTLSDDELPMPPMIAPPRSWAEVEERRRLFWGGFCIDSYASISAGWPTLIDVDQITTHLPAPEDAFTTGVEEKTSTLGEAFRGSGYSGFAGNVIICHIFTRLMKHAHRPMPGDCPEDPEFGPFWKRHRELDNLLSNAFMFMPERFRLPANARDPVALQANLNLHGAVICLHIAARERADKFKLAGLRQASRNRALTAAQEIIDIMRASTHTKTTHKGPLMALSLYFAASVYVAQAKDSPDEFDKSNLELIIKFMNAIGHQHIITHSYLNQLLLDCKRIGISISAENLPSADIPSESRGHGIPLVARASTSRHTKMRPPLPGRLPLGAPQGTIQYSTSIAIPYFPCANYIGPFPESAAAEGPASKRMRTSAKPSPQAPPTRPPNAGMYTPSMWPAGQRTETFVDPAPDVFEYTGEGWSYSTKFMTTTAATTTLPHRTGSPAIHTSRGMPGGASNTMPAFTGFSMPGSGTTPFPQMPGAGPPLPELGALAGFGMSMASTTMNTSPDAGNPDSLDPEALRDLNIFENLGEWGVADPEGFYAMLVDSAGDDFGGGTSQESMDPWAQLNSAAAGGSSSSAGAGGTGGGGTWDTGGGGGGGARSG